MAVSIIGGNGLNYLQEGAPSNPSLNEIWQQISTGERWRWNGTYWLGNDIILCDSQRSGTNTASFRGMFIRSSTNAVFISQVIIDYFLPVANYNFRLTMLSIGSDTNGIDVFNEDLLVAGSRERLVRTPNQAFIDQSRSQITSYMTRLNATAGSWNYNYNLTYNIIKH